MPRTHRRDSGFALTYLLTTLLLLVAGTAAAIVFIENPVGEHPFVQLLVGGCVLFAATLLLLEWRRDSHEAYMFAGMYGMVTAMGCGAVVHYGNGPHPVALALAICAAVGAAVCLGLSTRTGLSDDRFPNLLVQRFRPGEIREEGGVQFAVRIPKSFEVGRLGYLEFCLQNCWDAPRTVSFSLERGGFGRLGRGPLIFPPEFSRTLGPGEVAVAFVPLIAAASAPRWASLLASPSVSGDGGKRVRGWRATEASRRLPKWLTAFFLLTIHVAYRGGELLRLRIRRAEIPAKDANELPSVQSKSVWVPDSPVRRIEPE